MRTMQQVTLLDFGGAYTQQLARLIRDSHVYCEVLPYTTPLETVMTSKPKGLILCGGELSVTTPGAPQAAEGLWECGVPVLGIGYGYALMAQALGGRVEAMAQHFDEEIAIRPTANSTLFAQCPPSFTLHACAADCVDQMPQGFTATALCANGCIFAMEDAANKRYGIAAHKAIGKHPQSAQMIHNFLFTLCGCVGDWQMDTFIEACVADIRAQVGEQGRVLLGLSGGVDSSVCAALIYKAIGDRLTCVFVNTGFMRKGEPEQVHEIFTSVFPVNLVMVDAVARFQSKVDDVDDPERKRKSIGAEFIEVFAEEARALGELGFLGQGTIYPDIIESGAIPGAPVIKSHHNVGGLPADLKFTGLVEPLRYLFKDEVRRCGEALGLPRDMVWRQPFPGPGLAVRVVGAITQEKLHIVRESDAIVREEIAAAGLDRSINQYFALLTGVRTVGIHGGERSYDYTIGIRAVVTDNFVTGDWARIPHEVLGKMSARIVSEVPHVNRVVYDITAKPPAAIEWE